MPLPTYDDLESSVSSGTANLLIKMSHHGRAILFSDSASIFSVPDVSSLIATDSELGIPVVDTLTLSNFLSDIILDNPMFATPGNISQFTSILGTVLVPADRYVSFNNIPVKTSEFANNGSDTGVEEVSITFPIDSAIATYYMTEFHRNETLITVWRFHRENPYDIRRYWSGQLNGHEVKDETSLTLLFTSQKSRMDGVMYATNYSKLCRHVLYSPQCGVLEATYRVNATITGYSANSIVVDFGLGVFADNYFTHGVVEFSDYVKIGIFQQIGGSLLLYGRPPLYDSLLPAPVTILPGCDLSLFTCNSKFNNLLQYGGFPFIPQKAPFGGLNVFIVGVT